MKNGIWSLQGNYKSNSVCARINVIKLRNLLKCKQKLQNSTFGFRQMSFWPVLDNNACVMEDEATLNAADKIEIIDDLQVYLMSAILAFSTDGIVTKLNRPDVVDRIQEYYLTMLHRYLKYRYGDEEAINRLSRGMQITSMAREAKEICKTRLLI